MHLPSISIKSVSALSGFFLLIIFAFSIIFSQEPQTSPEPSPAEISAGSPTPSPTRVPTPTPTPLPGAQNFHQWGSVTVFNGLPSDSVRAISQTSDGVMWFGTDNGLARFDGRRIQNYSPGGPDTNPIFALKTAASGELWIGTQRGAFVYGDNRFRLVDGTKDVAVTTILIGSEIFLGTDAGLVFRVSENGDGFAASQITSDPIFSGGGDKIPPGITGLNASEEKLFVGTYGRGVFVFADGKFAELATSPRPLFVNSIARDGDGDIWLGTDAASRSSGIFRVEENGRVSRFPTTTGKVLAFESNDDGLWVGTERYGLLHLVGQKIKKAYTFENTSGGLRSNTVFTLFTDREGVLWIGTNRGVSRFDTFGASQETVSNSANSNFIRTLFRQDDGRIFAGSNRGLFVSDGNDWRLLPGFGGKVIYAVAENKDKNMLIGTANGLFDRTGKIIIPGDVRDIADLGSRTFAAIYGRGLVEIHAGNATELSGFAADDSVTSICEGTDRLWIGTADKGLFSFDGDSVKSEIGPDILKSGTIWGMFAGTDGTLWIAGQHGVFRVRNGSAEMVIEAEEVRDVFVAGENVWAATTTRGLMHAREDSRFGWLVSSVGFEQGLPSEKAFSILPVEEGLLVATNRGVVTYRRGTVEPKLIPTRILSQRVHDLNEIRSNIQLDYPQNSLLIEVAGQSSRTFPEEFQYAFVLKNEKGEELDRRISSESQYAPNELAPGQYLVEAIAFDRDLLASAPLKIHFSVAKAPFPWTATALGVLLVLALAGLALAFAANRRVRTRNRELAAARLDLANEAERERRRIARDLHDQTLADLRSLMLLSDNSAPKVAGFRDEIEAISGEVRRICEDLSPSVLENVGLVAALEFLLGRTIGDHRFTAKENLEESLLFPMHVQLQIYRIAQEILTNIKSHSDADTVEMELDDTDDAFVMSIRDNGTAFSPEDAASEGRGIANIKARASMINAVIDWGKRRDRGNRFVLRIPK